MDSAGNIFSQQFSDGKTIIDKLEYNSISYWWFIDNGIYLSKFNGKIGVKNIIVSLLELIPSNPFIVRVGICLFGYLNKLLSLVITNRKTSYLSTSRGGLNHKIVYRFELIEWGKRNQLDNNNGYYNLYNESICEELSKYGADIVTPYQELPIEILINSFDKYRDIQKTNTSFISCNVWEYFSCGCCCANDVDVILNCKKLWNELKRESDWITTVSNLLNVDEKRLKVELKKGLILSIPYEIIRGVCMDKIIRENNPDAIVLTDEQTTSGRYILYLARKHGIPTIGIQHGGIAKHPSYLNHDSLLVSSSRDCGVSFPVPDITCVWGDFEYNLLVTHAGYPEGQVVVTGNPRYDYLGQEPLQYNRDDFCKRYGINSKSTIVLWVTQSHGWSNSENQAYFSEIFDTFYHRKDITLIIKQHPGETEQHKQLIDTYLKKYELKCNVVVPDKMGNTTEMVYISDIIIQKSSTTGQEAVAFHKPLIIMDFSDEPDYGKYVEEGVGLPVFEKGGLGKVVSKIIDIGIDMNVAQNEYVKNHMHKLDGNAHKRIASVIRQTISQRNRL
ncbi:MAG: hypothetical protein IJA20_03210 [Methanocorpusculum sp.]|nr:hypothetical protein [Oscillospiraceae bacterium]MBQ3569665.1 hypothetical protein [Methanocorpusculum sp.]